MGCEFSFIHCADLHLGSRAWGITHEDRELSSRFFGTSFASFSRIVDVCIGKADFMVIAGDVYDELVETPRTRLFFVNEMRRLGKPCFVVKGNHDHIHSWSGSIPYPDNVYVFGTSPQAFRLNIRGRNVEIVGISFDGPHTDANLVSKLRGSPGYYTIGVAHCSVSSSDGNPYAPCSMEDFMGKDVQYWALGHIHKRRILREADPTIVYPGNIQGRDIGESGEKGCMLVSVEGGSTSIEFIPTQEILWREVVADITGRETLQQLVQDICTGTDENSIICIAVTGKGPLNQVIRREPGVLSDAVTSATGCPALIRSISCGPEIDMDKAAEGGTIISDIIRASGKFSSMSDMELLDLLCAKGPATDVRIYLEYFAKHGMLGKLVEEAELSAINRILEGEE